jgi:hypothetical protein
MSHMEKPLVSMHTEIKSPLGDAVLHHFSSVVKKRKY